ncbi:MAG: hypothetical protein ACRC1K_04045, partial [Planctomycetia bacterium]
TLIEPFIAGGAIPVPIKTSDVNVAAVAFRHEHGVLVMPYWRGQQAQWQLGAASVPTLQLMVENAPESAQAYQISLGEVRALPRSKDLGGIRIQMQDFDASALILLTTNLRLVSEYQERVQMVASQAAAWHREMAELQLAKTEAVHGRLQEAGRWNKRAPAALVKAREYIDKSRAAGERNDYRASYAESVRSLRFARGVQQYHMEQALYDLNVAAAPSPAAAEKPFAPKTSVHDPFLLCFYTLPEHYGLEDGLKNSLWSPNQLVGGGFETDRPLDALGWSYRPYSADGYETAALMVAEGAKEGKRALELTVTARKDQLPVTAVENTRIEIVSPAVKVAAGQVARLRGYIRLPVGSTGSVDGLMVWDSIGGESMALRFLNAGDWQPFEIIRPIHAAGEIQLHLATTGVGPAQFDDLSIEIARPGLLPLAGVEPAAPRLR